MPEQRERDVQIRVLSLGSAQPDAHRLRDTLDDLELLMLERGHASVIRVPICFNSCRRRGRSPLFHAASKDRAKRSDTVKDSADVIVW